MYLKSIEIQGFKSFANKIIFDFHNGITGIVGPNGSGKSNVADAVRWVLGEQKVKQLRSSSMQDVIFAGTENRKPLSYAYVAITLDNSDHQLALDYKEVTVARRVYRSGESEYLLNGTACRLKDIQELFYDTGIGKEGYSIIGQGQIDKILSGKPEERRELFDEAAGIVKYKRRKAMTMKKLENEQQNLVRVNDILSELERQIGPLERQSEHAKTYLKKKEELKSYDVNLFLLESERMEQELAETEEKYTIADEELKLTQEKYAQIKARYEQLEEQIAEAESQLELLRQQTSDSGLEKEKTEGQINVLKEQIRGIRQNEAHVKERMDSLSGEIERREQSGKQYTEEMAALEQEMSSLELEQEQLQEKVQKIQEEEHTLETAVNEGKNDLLALIHDRSGIKVEQQKFDTMLEQAEIRKAQLNQQLVLRKSTGGDVDEQLAMKEAALEELHERILGMEKKKIELHQKREKWRIQSEDLRKKLEEANQQFHRERSRLESLQNIAERYDGYGNSIRRVMERKSDTPGILGVVADLIKVDARYETAVETALGGGIQNIVTDHENTAKKMIAYLKERRYGRATFLPLTSVSAPEQVPARKALSEPGAIGLADSLVTTEEKFRGVAGHLLGRVLVVDTIDHAIAIQKKFRQSLRIVTLEGESLQPGGSMTGGAFKNNSNLLGRNREIEDLQKKIEACRNEGKQIHDRLEDVHTADELLKDDLQELQEKLQEIYLEQNTLEVEVEHCREERKQQEASYNSIQMEIHSIEKEKEEIRASKQQILDQASGSEEQEKQLTEQNEALAKQLDEKHVQLQQALEELNQKKLQIAQLRQKTEFLRENTQRVAEEILLLHTQQQEILLAASQSDQNIEEKEMEIRRLGGEMERLSEYQSAMQTQLQELNARKDEMSAEHRTFFEQREEVSEHLARLDKEIFRLNDRREKLEKAEETLTNYMWNEYELTRHAAESLKTPDLPGTAQLKQMIAGVKDEIRKLGNVNVNAIEEYKEVSERYEFLHTQHSDLMEAEKVLQDIITELEEGMRKQFSEKFAEIQVEFDRAFKELFGGGKGTLELAMEDDKDILECGVRIIAQPPGKKLQNMMQLSGGEKALTAISLLFAIQNLKPSPFCLLDEIEAALDDSNVDRYAKYLHKLTKNTQFIVITHRRGTMTAADRLYGITMQEKGVSTLVSVNLIEKELDA